MNLIKRVVLSGGVGVLILGLIFVAKADKRIPMVTSSELAGAWIGNMGLVFFRLELDKDGTGYFSESGSMDREGRIRPDSGEVHRVTKWALNEYVLQANLDALQTNKQNISIAKSFVTPASMDLEFSRGDEKFQVVFFREEDGRIRQKKMEGGIGAYRKRR